MADNFVVDFVVLLATRLPDGVSLVCLAML